MDFSEAKSHAMSVLFDTELFSKSATYIPKNGDPIPDVPVNILYGISNNDDGRRGDGNTWRLVVKRDSRAAFHGNYISHVATVVVRVSDIASPEYRDTIEIDGEVWTVTEIYDA